MHWSTLARGSVKFGMLSPSEMKVAPAASVVAVQVPRGMLWNSP